MNRLHPIVFSIPECKITDKIPTKTKILSRIIPGDLRTYGYTDEEKYYNEYKESLFATTFKKAGWDCMRHYEIIANGTIPYFPDIDNCPPNTLALFPKEMIKYGNILFNKHKDKQISDLSIAEKKECDDLIIKLLTYMRNRLTTAKMAEYILAASSHTSVKNILFLSGCVEADYLRCVTLHGFKQILGKNCHDYPKVPHIYMDKTIDYKKIYGRGFSFTNLLNQDLHDNGSDKTVKEDIVNHKYDIIIYGSYHRGMPLYDLVIQHYKREDIILICGEDIHRCNYMEHINNGHHVYVREI